ncbi:MAG: hypothetical protein HYV60_17670 [Planctomycetia bacterium]|nr:hypothetical protein [Planctomycetia bacterium]
MTRIKLGTIVFAFLAVTAFVWASESDELREKAKMMQREAADLAEHGHKAEATNLKHKAMAMLEEAERLQHAQLGQQHPEIMKLKQWLEKLRQEEKLLGDKAEAGERLADVRREAEQVEAKLRAVSQGPHRDQAPPHEDIARRLKHMRIAADHLNQAGLHDVAEHVAQRAEAAERELHEQHRHHEGDPIHEIMKQLDGLRHEVGRLRDEVNELRKKQ